MIIQRGGFFYNPTELGSTSVPAQGQGQGGWQYGGGGGWDDSDGRPAQAWSWPPATRPNRARLIATYTDPRLPETRASFAPTPVSADDAPRLAMVDRLLASAALAGIQRGDLAYVLRGSVRLDAVLAQLTIDGEPGTRVYVIRAVREAGLLRPAAARAIAVAERGGATVVRTFDPSYGPPRGVHESVYVVVVRACGTFSCNTAPARPGRPVHAPEDGRRAPIMSSMPGSYLHSGSPALSVAW
jgi:hypothetical protein